MLQNCDAYGNGIQCQKWKQDTCWQNYLRVCNEWAKHPQPIVQGLAVADIDSDGYLDISITHHGASKLFLRNIWRPARAEPVTGFFALRLAGPAARLVGAVVTLVTRDARLPTSPQNR